MVKTLYLFRHGQTPYNARRLFYGSSDISINEVGKQQAKKLKENMTSCVIDALYVSCLKRTHETAQIIFPNSSFHIMKEFDEKGFGLWEGMDANAIQDAFPTEWQNWLDAPFTYTPPEAESFASFEKRVIDGITKIMALPNETVAIVAHLGTLRILYQQLVDKNAVFWDIDFPQDDVVCLQKKDNQWTVKETKR